MPAFFISKINNTNSNNNDNNNYSPTSIDSINSETTNRSEDFQTVRYINSAAFVLNDAAAQIDGPSQAIGADESDEFMNKNHITVPQIDINFTDSTSSSGEHLNQTFSYRNKFTNAELLLKRNDAFKEWLSAKKQLEKQRQLKQLENQQKLEYKKNMETKKRYELSNEKLNEWFKRKDAEAKEKLKQFNEQMKIENQKFNNMEKNFIGGGGGGGDGSGDSYEDKKANYNAWVKRKVEHQKLMKRIENEKCDLQNEYCSFRKLMAENEYRKWYELSKYKGKPVPLNQGLLSLRGSISQMYINPISWVSTDDCNTTLNHNNIHSR